MLEKITWSQYWTTIASTTAFYYAGVGIVFYKKKILSFFNHASPLVEKSPSDLVAVNIMGSIKPEALQKIEETPISPPVDNSQEDTPENIQILDKTTLTGEQITHALEDLGINTDCEQIVRSLSTIIKKENTDGTLTPFRKTLDWHISQTALDTCGITLENEDLDTIWNTA